MKKNIRKIILFCFVILTLFTCLNNTCAVTKNIMYKDISTEQNLQIQELDFQNIAFKDYSAISTKAFGLTGSILNTSNNNIIYNAKVTYYDSNYYLIAEDRSYATALTGFSNFNLMSNLAILNGYNVSDIRYYTLEITIDERTEIGGTINSSMLTPSENNEYRDKEYVIDKYDININVNENNTLDITETIIANFNIPKHGIFRTIPLSNEITRLDGTTDKNRTQVTNVSVDCEYTTSRENGNYKIKIGSADYTLTGKQRYVIKYTYNLGEDVSDIYDEIYYNIIGTEWDTAIGNVTFTINMPKSFDVSKLGFSSGYKGSVENSKVMYNVSGNKITGSYNGILNAGEALTIRCELPEGYFVGAGLEINKTDCIMFGIPVILLIIAIVLWKKYGRDELVVETVEFYPPEGMNSLDVGFAYRGKAENKDVTSLLVYLANKGYIEIVDKKINTSSKKINLNDEAKENSDEKIIELENKIAEEKAKDPNSKKIKYYENMLDIYRNIDKPIDYEGLGAKSAINKTNSKEKYIIKKLKEYDGNDENEKKFMEGLFKNSRTEVTDSMLYDSFYITNSIILHRKNSKENKNKIFEKSSTNKKWILILMMIISYLLITVPTILTYGEPATLIFALIFPTAGFSVLGGMVFGRTNIIEKIFAGFWGVMFGGVPWLAIVLPALQQDNVYMLGYVIGMLAIIGIAICMKFMKKRTKYGNEILGKLRGFKNFLETAEKERLEALVMENPNYFYDILPYTYVLDVSDKWIKKFESMSIEEPEWYHSNDAFNMHDFGRFMNSTMTSAQRSMSSSPSSSSGGSSGGSSSGGGSSGGGSGGGGGGSW